MYGIVLGAGTAVASTSAALMLPAGSGNLFINLAVALGAALAVWGVTYAHTR